MAQAVGVQVSPRAQIMIIEEKIEVKAMCLFVYEGRVLVASGKTFQGKKGGRKIVPGDFYRVLGGSMNFRETSEQAVRREIQEELQSEINNLEFLNVAENIFIYAGEKRHEIVFLFSGQLARKDLYHKEIIHIVEDSYEGDAIWVPIGDILNGEIPLYPSTNYKNVFEKIKII